MTKIVVLFNLKEDVDVTAYESWAVANDLPTVNALASVDQFDVLRTTGLLTGGAAPYQYIEILDIPDMETFGKDIATETMKKVASEFQAFADAPLFVMTEALVG